MSKSAINPGDLVKDRITGFEGIVTSVEYYIQGVRKASVQPTALKDGLPQEGIEYDFENLDIIKKKATKVTPVVDDMGFKLGDAVSSWGGYKGTIRSVRISISGCIQFAVYSGKLSPKDHLPMEGLYFQPSDLTLVSKGTQKLAATQSGPARVARRSFT